MEAERTVTDIVRTKIKRKGPGSTFSYSDFEGLSFIAVAKALSRFTKEGWLVRVRKGIYHFPKETALGKTMPRLNDLLEKTPWTHGLILTGSSATSSSASYNLGITTQVPAEIVLIGDYPNRTMDLAGTKIKTRRRNTAHLKHLGETEFDILETIRRINKTPGADAGEVITAIKKHVLKCDVKSLAHAALKEPPRVRAVLGAMLDEIIKYRKLSVPLKKSLNPLTTYNLGLAKYLAHADAWGIR
ncbi:MAG: DUF6088 family protein [Bdellovibrionales bacterium]